MKVHKPSIHILILCGSKQIKIKVVDEDLFALFSTSSSPDKLFNFNWIVQIILNIYSIWIVQFSSNFCLCYDDSIT